MRVTAQCTRVDGWWSVDVPEVPGVFTQARRLDQVEDMVADAVETLTDVPAAMIVVDVVPVLDETVSVIVKRAAEQRNAAEAAQAQAAGLSRSAAHALRNQGLPLRDVGSVLGVSYQRAHQLLQMQE